MAFYLLCFALLSIDRNRIPAHSIHSSVGDKVKSNRIWIVVFWQKTGPGHLVSHIRMRFMCNRLPNMSGDWGHSNFFECFACGNLFRSLSTTQVSVDCNYSVRSYLNLCGHCTSLAADGEHKFSSL